MSGEGWKNFLDVRKGKRGEQASMVSVGFIRRYHIPTEKWNMDFFSGNFDSYQWALTPMPAGVSAKKRKLNWNTIEMMRSSEAAPLAGTAVRRGSSSELPQIQDAMNLQASMSQGQGLETVQRKHGPVTKYHDPVPLWWDLQGTDPNIGGSFPDSFNVHSATKKIGGAIKRQTYEAGKELRDILDYEGGSIAMPQTSLTAPEEMWTQFVMEGIAAELKGKQDKIDMLDGATNEMMGYIDEEQNRQDDNYMHRINPLGIDFLSTSLRDALEHQLFNVLLDNAFGKGGGWYDKLQKSTSVGREHTSEVTTKYWSKDLSDALTKHKDIKKAFHKNTQELIKPLEQELLKMSGDLVAKIHSIKSGKKANRGSIEDLLYYAKQTADRALNLAVASHFGLEPVKKGGKASYDYYLPIPPRSDKAAGIAAGSYLGQIRITPQVKVEEIKKVFESQSYKGITAKFLGIKANTRVTPMGGGSIGAGTMATPLNIILKGLVDTGVMSSHTADGIVANAKEQMRQHQEALTGISLAGAGFWQELQSHNIGEQMGGSLSHISVINIATGDVIAKNLHDQIKDVLESPQVQKGMGKWLGNQQTRTDDLTKSWRNKMGSSADSVIKTHNRWYNQNKQLAAAAGVKGEGVPFQSPFTITPTKGNLVGVPVFIAKGVGADYKNLQGAMGMGPVVSGKTVQKKVDVAREKHRTVWAGGTAEGLEQARGEGFGLYGTDQRLFSIV